MLALRSLARRIEAATAEADELEREILKHVRALVPELLDEPGVGPIVAAQLIVTWSHKDRVRSEAAFARLGRSTSLSGISAANRYPAVRDARYRVVNILLRRSIPGSADAQASVLWLVQS